MDLSPEERSRIYEDEKARLERVNNQSLEAGERRGRHVIAVLFVVGLLALMFAVSKFGNSHESPVAQEELTEAEKMRRGCLMVHQLYDNKPVSDLSLNNLKQLQLCQGLGY